MRRRVSGWVTCRPPSARHGVDVPAVAVLDPVGRGDRQPPVVAPGDDRCRRRWPRWRRAAEPRAARPSRGEPVGPGAQVQLADQLVGRAPAAASRARPPGRPPGRVGLLDDGGVVAGVDAVVVEVVAQRDRVADAQRERRTRLDRIGETDDRVEAWRRRRSRRCRAAPRRPRRGRQLAGVTDQPDTRPAIEREGDHPVEIPGARQRRPRRRSAACGASIASTQLGTGCRASRECSSLATVSVACRPIAARSCGRASPTGRARRRCRRRRSRRWRARRARWSCPVPAGAIASCTRAPGSRQLADQVGLAGVEPRAVGRRLQQRQLDRAGIDGAPVVRDRRPRPAAPPPPAPRATCRAGCRRPRTRSTRPRRRSAAGFDQPIRVAQARPTARVTAHRRVAASTAVVERGQRHVAAQRASRSTSARTWLRLPGRAPRLDPGDRIARRPAATQRSGQLRIADRNVPVSVPGRRSPSIAVTASSPPSTAAASACHRRALLGLRARGVLALAGSRGWPAGTVAGSSATSGARPCRRANSAASSPWRSVIACRRDDQNAVSAGSTPTISRTGRLSAAPAPAGRRSATPSRGDQLRLEPRVVPLGRRDRGLVQHPAVERPPPPVQRLDLVRDRDVRVQVRVAGAGVAMGERDGEQPAWRRPARTPSWPEAGVGRGLLEPGDDVADGRVVRGRDLARDARVGQRPQRRDALDRGEGQVIAGDRRLAGPGRAGDVVGQLPRVVRLAPVVALEPLPAQLGADRAPAPRRGPQRSAGCAGVAVVADDPLGQLAAELARAARTVNGVPEPGPSASRLAGGCRAARARRRSGGGRARTARPSAPR